MRLKVVTAASGFEQKASRAPATVTVITSEEWQAKGARLLSDVLATVPGFHVGKPHLNFNHQKFVVRGLSGSGSVQIKLLIDGEPFESQQSNNLFFGFRMPLTHFQRIEVVKGPGSAVYGADAFGGVINLVTYKHFKMPSLLGARAGAFSTTDVFARDHFSINSANFQWSFEYSQSDDDKNRIVETDLQSTFDGIFGSSASNAPGPIDEHYEVLSLMAKWQWQDWRINYFTWRNFDEGLGAGIAQVLDPSGESATQVNQYQAEYDFNDWIIGELKATLSYKQQWTETYLNVFPAGAILPIGADGNVNFVNPKGLVLFEDGFIGTPSSGGHSTTLRLTHLLDLSDQHLFRWTLGYEKQRFNATQRKNSGPGILDGSQMVVSGDLTDVTGTPYVYLPNINRYFYYLSLQDEWQITPDIQLTLGVRHDDYSDFGATTNPRLGLIWQLSDRFTLKLFAGSAFRAPSIGELYAQNNPVGIGNPALGPETVDTLETGLNFEFLATKDLALSLSVFDYHAKDLIDFVFDEQRQGNLAQNIGEQKGKGGEFTLKWKPQSHITLDFHYSQLWAEDKAGVDIADIPNKMAYLGVNWQITADWFFNMDAKWVAERYRNITDARGDLANYTQVTAKLERKNIMPGLSVALLAKNLFDDDAREPSNGSIAEDYPLPGQQLLLEFNYQF